MRDDTNNGCVADYWCPKFTLFSVTKKATIMGFACYPKVRFLFLFNCLVACLVEKERFEGNSNYSCVLSRYLPMYRFILMASVVSTPPNEIFSARY